MMRGMFASAGLLLAARCTPFDGASEAVDGGAADGGGGDGARVDGPADDADAGGAVLVGEVAKTGSKTSTLTVTLPAPPGHGHVLVLVVGSNGNHATGVAGGGATSWVNAAQSGLHVATAIWVGLGVSQPTPDVTITWAAQQPAAAALLTEWAGLSALDSPGAPSMGSSTTPTITPLAAQPGQLLFAAAGTQSTASTPTNGFSAVATAALSPNVSVVGAYLKVGAAGSYGTSWTMPTANGWDAMLVALH
jgi:hypothetical protein